MADEIRPVWTQNDMGVLWSVVHLPNGNVAVRTSSDLVWIIDPTDGRTVAKLAAEGNSNGLVLTAGDDLVVTTNRYSQELGRQVNNLFIFDATNLSQKIAKLDTNFDVVFCADLNRAYGPTGGNGNAPGFGAVLLHDGSEDWDLPGFGDSPAAFLFQDKLYVAAATPPALRVLDPVTGRELGTEAPAAKGTALALGRGRAYLGTVDAAGNGAVTAYELPSRTRLWSRPTAGEPGGTPMASEAVGGIFPERDVVHVTTELGNLETVAQVTQFDRETGTTRWERRHGNRRMGAVGVKDAMVFVPMVERGADWKPGGGVLCLDERDGREIFRTYFDRMSGVTALPLDIGVLFHTFHSIALFQPAMFWSRMMSAAARVPPTARDDRVVVGTTSGGIHCFDAASGMLLWSATGDGPVNAAPAIARGRVFVGSGSTVLAFDTAAGTQMWRVNIGSTIIGSLTLAPEGENLLALGTEDGTAFVFDTTTGREAARIEVGGAVSAPIVISDGVLLVGSDIGILGAWGTDGRELWRDEGVPRSAGYGRFPARVPSFPTRAGPSASFPFSTAPSPGRCGSTVSLPRPTSSSRRTSLCWRTKPG